MTDPNPNRKLNLAEVREKLAGKRGQQYWRSLEEVAETDEFTQWLDDEFPNRSTLLEIDRRTMLKFMGASVALAGLAGCRGVFLDTERIVPYVNQPEMLLPGKPLFYATAGIVNGYGVGMLLKQLEGRPAKIEGNPEHPGSLGAIDSIGQAQILGMYDPDRASTVLSDGEISTWQLFLETARAALERQKASQGAGVRILCETVNSPTLARQLAEFQSAFPKSAIHQYEPGARDNAFEGAKAAFGEPVHTVYKFRTAKVIVSLDSDFLVSEPGSLPYARQFADARRVVGSHGEMNRLYVFDSTPTVTGSAADHRWAVRASDIESVARSLASKLGATPETGTLPGSVLPKHLDSLAKDLQANAGASVVIAGPNQPPSVHALAHAMNEKLGNVGKTVTYTAPVEPMPVNRAASLRELVDALTGGRVELMLIVGGNPVYDAPSDFRFAEALDKAKLRIRLGAYYDETSEHCQWHLPESHFLEQWSDVRAYDGTISIVQPLIAPLYGDAKSAHELVAALLNQPSDAYNIIRATHNGTTIKGDFEKGWARSVHDGLIADTALPQKTVKLRSDFVAATTAKAPKTNGLEINFRLDSSVHDGRYANNGWLQELPKPLTKLTWDNAALVSPETADSLKIETGSMLELTYKGRTIVAPAFVMPGQPSDAITIAFGFGRTKTGTVGTGVGVDAYPLRGSDAMWFDTGLEVKKAAGAYRFAATQTHHGLDDRDVVRAGILATFNEGASNFPPADYEDPHEHYNTMYPEEIFAYNGPQWGMTIDLNTCIGCNACITACQAENNIPVVGKDQVAKGREMHWIRVDRYYKGGLENPDTVFQPVMCVHCEKAPCEPVCPVAATVHSHEGLNQMVYNRCVGTRYCSNNCPYKVRRFNYLNFTDNQPQFTTPTAVAHEPKENGISLLKMLNNPDVTVRGRGVMEKCSYCVQRINSARIEAKKQGRDPKEGEIVTACQQACPTQTIVFGNIAQADSKVSQLRKDPRSYLLLQELNTRPRTSHLAKLYNPNPEITA